jgi:hypothetical protein
MNTELSLATSTEMPGGKSARTLSMRPRTAADKIRGLAVAWRMTPREMASRPFNRTDVRSSWAPSAMRATSSKRTGTPLTVLSAIWPNSVARRRSVAAVTLNSRCPLSMRPAGTSRLLRRNASSTSCTVRRYAAKRSGSSQTRMLYLRSPYKRTSAAPGAVCNTGLTSRLARSESCSASCVSELSASQMTGNASASTLATTGSSISRGNFWRTRLTLSRTSAAAESGSRSSLNLTVIWLCSWRLTEVITSTPSMPATESSITFVTCDSTTSLEAPTSRLETVTTGSSILGYSRTLSRLNDTRPINRISRDSTVANTGRRTEISGSCMV